MQAFPKNLFIQNLDGSILRENFLISAIVTIFVIRIFLKFTGYPQLGGSELHIAHLLWGGFFMLASIIIMFSFLSRSAFHIASILGGIGFGTFIDELGKFITRDNDYFFEPTLSIIYAIFVFLYIFNKLLERQKVSPQEHLINALEMTKEAVAHDFDTEEKNKTLYHLRKSNPKDPLTIALKHFVQEVNTIPSPPPSLFIKIRHVVKTLYLHVANSHLLVRVIVILLILQPFITIFSIFIQQKDIVTLSFVEYGKLFSSLLSTFFILSGLLSFFLYSHFFAYRLLKAAILTTLLLTQFFLFYDEPLIATFGTAFNILLLFVIDYILDKENPAEKG